MERKGATSTTFTDKEYARKNIFMLSQRQNRPATPSSVWASENECKHYLFKWLCCVIMNITLCSRSRLFLVSYQMPKCAPVSERRTDELSTVERFHENVAFVYGRLIYFLVVFFTWGVCVRVCERRLLSTSVDHQ